MAWTVSKDWNYPTTSGATLTMPVIEFGNLSEVEDRKGNGVTFTDTTAPVDRPSTTHLEYHVKQNIYQNTGIDRAFWTPSVRGFQIYLQQNDVYSITQGDEKYYVPISSSFGIKSAMHEAITADVVLDHMAFTIAHYFGKGVSTATRLASLMRGALDITK